MAVHLRPAARQQIQTQALLDRLEENNTRLRQIANIMNALAHAQQEHKGDTKSFHAALHALGEEAARIMANTNNLTTRITQLYAKDLT